MNSNDIRTKVESALDHEQRTGTAAKLTAQTFNLTSMQVKQCIDFAAAYIRETPDLMDAVFQAAIQYDVRSKMQPIFEVAFSYWDQIYDFIPDNLGLVGLADDAYLTRMLLEASSVRHDQQTGQRLLSVDSGPMNQAMRQLIGEPVASKLDAIVYQSFAGESIQRSLEQLISFIGPMSIPMPHFGSYMSQYDIDQEVNVRLGAMGVV